jgi:hypothetical protein
MSWLGGAPTSWSSSALLMFVLAGSSPFEGVRLSPSVLLFLFFPILLPRGQPLPFIG